MNKYLIGLLLCACAAAQPIQNVAISKTPSSPSITTLTFYTSLGSPQYICKAPSLQPLYTWSVTPSSQQGTLTSIVVATNVGTVTTAANHGLQVNDVVVVAGSTTTALNGTYVIQTVPSTTTFTITTVGVSNATYNTAALQMTTTAPRSNASIWSIEQYTYGSTGGASGNPIADQWATSLSNAQQGGTVAFSFSCDARTTLGYQ